MFSYIFCYLINNPNFRGIKSFFPVHRTWMKSQDSCPGELIPIALFFERCAWGCWKHYNWSICVFISVLGTMNLTSTRNTKLKSVLIFNIFPKYSLVLYLVMLFLGWYYVLLAMCVIFHVVFNHVCSIY